MAIKWKWLNRMVHDFRAGEPGHRFVSVYEHRQQHATEHPVRSWILMGVGFLFLVVGVIIALPPGVPGFFLWIPGILMIATRARWAAALLDRAEGAVEKGVVWWKARRGRKRDEAGGKR